MKLNDRLLKSLKPEGKPYKRSDGGGLYIEIMPTGSMYWRMSYRIKCGEKLKQKRLAFGVYPRTSLKEAREKRDDAKKLLDNGMDPGEIKKLQKVERATEYANSFEAIAREWHENKIHTWKPKHADNILKRLDANIFPLIGSRPIKSVTPPELLIALKKVEERGTYDLAHRIMQSCAQVFRYAVATGRAERDITADLRGALRPAKSKTLAHLSEDELPDFLKELEKYDTEYGGRLLTKLAFKFLVLTFVRSGEIRGAKWDEIDWEKKQWRIPEERMKMNSPHIVPLAKQSIALLQEIKKLTGDNCENFIFPSQQTPRKMMSENTFLRVIEVMGYKGRTVGHGFRSTASTILNENQFNKDCIERQLAHCERDQVRGAYNHAEYLKERANMMQWWADYLDKAYG